MENIKLPVMYKNLTMLYNALSLYRKTGQAILDNETILNQQIVLKEKLDSVRGDQVSQALILLDLPESEKMARIKSFKENEADLDILIARLQVLRRKMEGNSDSVLVEDLLKELADEGLK